MYRQEQQLSPKTLVQSIPLHVGSDPQMSTTAFSQDCEQSMVTKGGEPFSRPSQACGIFQIGVRDPLAMQYPQNLGSA